MPRVTINGLVRWTINRGVAGLEAWAGTPGTVGGAIYGNAHFQGRNIGELVDRVAAVDRDAALVEVPASEMEFGYDFSRLQRTGEFVVSADFHVSTAIPPPSGRRRASRSRFENAPSRSSPRARAASSRIPIASRDRVPAGIPPSAGALVDRAGLKGSRRRQRARFDDPRQLHRERGRSHGRARFATLIDRCKREVREQFGVELREEIVYLGFEGECGGASNGLAAYRRWQAAIGTGLRRGQQKLGAPAVRGLPPDRRRVRARERAAHPRCRGPDRVDARPGGHGRRRWHNDNRKSGARRSRPTARPGPRRQTARLGAPARPAARADVVRPGWRSRVATFPARRTIATHLQASNAMGAVALDEPGHALDAPNGLNGASMYLDEASVTGTETALLAARWRARPHRDSACRDGASRRRAVSLSARDGRRHRRGGHVDDPCRGAGAMPRCAPQSLPATTSRLAAGVSSRPSPVETFVVTGARAADIEVVAAPLEEHGSPVRIRRTTASPSNRRRSSATRRLTTGLWPGFPSDMVSLVTVLATQADGRTLVHDWLYELRLFALEQLSAMRADLFLCDPHRIIVSGPTRLARSAAGCSRSALGHGAHCGGAWRLKGRAG